MNSKEWLSVMEKAEDYNHALTPLIIKYGELLLSESPPLSPITEGEKKNRWLQGYACAVAKLLEKLGINDTHTDELFYEGVGSIKKAIDAGVHEYDIEEFKKYYK